ncbi:hypothetical protein D3502_00610 [Salmonella enterica]|nr:hypothetical protein [Salmonella enterica]ECI8009785.1 hypothetical protein [Salmonella enterica subsp. enterica]EJH1053642.1 hypothetical protein [Salmonella enterica]EJU7419544.1 hypothetical protein [Salmonella enterica]
MTIPNIPEGMCLSLPPLNDINMRVILSYTTAKFTEDKNDAGCMARLAEIFLLGQMRPLADKLKALTCVSLPLPDTSPEEINLLLDRCAVIYKREAEEYDRCARESSRAKHALMAIKQPAQSVSDSRNRNKSSVRDAEDTAERAAINLSNQAGLVKDMHLLAGLLYDEAKTLSDSVDINRCMPRGSRIPEMFTRRNELLFIAAADTCNAIRSLRLAAEDIIRKCTPPKQDSRSPIQRNNLSHDGMIKSQAYRHYYQADNDLLRAIVSADDYAKYIAEFGWFMRETREPVSMTLNASVFSRRVESDDWQNIKKEND